jgi:predicted nucleotidyltransferase
MEPHPPVIAPPAPSQGPDDLRHVDPALVPLIGALEIARSWAGDRCLAMVLSGSHATGEGVWVEWDGRRVTLSDLDVYAVMPDDVSARAAAARARQERAGIRDRLLELGVAAPLETGFLTLSGLARLPAKPGTIELARRGRLVYGDAAALAGLPRHCAGDVPREETLLLLENRGFELLMARGPSTAAPLAALRARHALLKAVADLATVLALDCGELPEGAAARVAWAREHALPGLAARVPLEHQAGLARLPGLWESALAWRAGRVVPLGQDEARAEWIAAVRAWTSVWWALQGDGPREPWARVLRAAARAPIRRRARQALLAASRGAASSPLTSRVRSALVGTPQHRVNASAAVLLVAAAMSADVPALPVGALRALRVLDVTAAADWDDARRDVLRTWDHWVLDGQRAVEPA